MKKRTQHKNKTFVTIFGIVSVGIFFLIWFFMMKKEWLHVDEIYTYGLANSYYEPFPWADNEWLAGTYFLDYLTAKPDHLFNLNSVFYNQAQDVHPPFYYAIIHVISSFMPHIFSKWIGLSVNLVSHLLIYGGIFLALRLIRVNKWRALFGAAFWSLTVGALSSAVFIRMYSLLTLEVIALLYLSLYFFNKKKTGMLMPIYCTTVIGGLSHYYFYIYAFFLTITVIIVLLLAKRYRAMFQYGLTMVIGVLTSLLIFPQAINHVKRTGRGQEALQAEFSLDRFRHYVGSIFENLFGSENLGYLIIVGLCLFTVGMLIYCLLRQRLIVKDDFGRNMLVVFVPIIPTIIFVQTLSTLETTRYVYYIYPMIIMFIVILVDFIGVNTPLSIKKQILMLVSTGTLILGYNHTQQDVSYLFENSNRSLSVVGLYHDNYVLALSEDKWQLTNFILELKEYKQVYQFVVNGNKPFDLPMDATFAHLDAFVVYVNEPLNDIIYINRVKEIYHMKHIQKLYTRNHITAYYLKK